LNFFRGGQKSLLQTYLGTALLAQQKNKELGTTQTKI